MAATAAVALAASDANAAPRYSEVSVMQWNLRIGIDMTFRYNLKTQADVILKYNPDVPDSIRWIADDVRKFVKREIRRGNQYDLIALDPPTFGRGAKGEVWKIESDLPKLLEDCKQLHRPGRKFTLVLSCHSPGFSVNVLQRICARIFGDDCEFNGFEMQIPEASGSILPAGICLRLSRFFSL